VEKDAAQPILDGERFQERLALLRRNVDVTADNIGQPAGLIDLGQDLFDCFVGQAQLLPSSAARSRASRCRAMKAGSFGSSGLISLAGWTVASR